MRPRAVTIRLQERGSDYRVTVPEPAFDAAFGNGVEVRFAWNRTSRERKPYLLVKLDSPFLAAPINVALIEQEDGPPPGAVCRGFGVEGRDWVQKKVAPINIPTPKHARTRQTNARVARPTIFRSESSTVPALSR